MAPGLRRTFLAALAILALPGTDQLLAAGVSPAPDVAILHGDTVIATGAPTGLADSAALRATVFGTPPQDLAPLPKTVPLQEINIALPWARPVPAVFWFDRTLRVWFSAQNKPAPLAIVISGTGS